jgi:hypothetical protein
MRRILSPVFGSVADCDAAGDALRSPFGSSQCRRVTLSGCGCNDVDAGTVAVVVVELEGSIDAVEPGPDAGEELLDCRAPRSVGPPVSMSTTAASSV